MAHESIGLDDIQRSQRGDTGQRVAAKGRTVIAGLEHPGSASGRKAGADRHAGTKTFCQRHDIRQDAGMLMGEPGSGTAYAALYLVDHEQPVLAVADLPQ